MQKTVDTFRYETSGHWYKGNTHLHTTASDGGLSIEEVGDLYAGAGYDFLFVTDHWVESNVDPLQDKSPLLLLDGIEIHGTDDTGAFFHVACLGKTEGLKEEDGFLNGLQAAREQGALRILAHPHWCANTLENALRWKFDGVEIYNHLCHWANGKSSGMVHWTAMLERHPNTLALAVDDAHIRPEHPLWNGGWIVVNAAECSRDAVLDAIKRGNYFSSQGPAFKTLSYDGSTVSLTTSPVRFIRLAGPAWRGHREFAFDGPLLTEASLPVPEDWDYLYLEIEDEKGNRARTNALFSAEPLPAAGGSQ